MNYTPPAMSVETVSVSTRLDETPPSRPATNYAIESLHSENDLFFQNSGEPEMNHEYEFAIVHHDRTTTAESDTTLNEYEDTESCISALTQYEMSIESTSVRKRSVVESKA